MQPIYRDHVSNPMTLLDQLEAELAKVKAELARVKQAAAEVCVAPVDLADRTEALRKLGDAINYPGCWDLRW